MKGIYVTWDLHKLFMYAFFIIIYLFIFCGEKVQQLFE